MGEQLEKCGEERWDAYCSYLTHGGGFARVITRAHTHTHTHRRMGWGREEVLGQLGSLENVCP